MRVPFSVVPLYLRGIRFGLAVESLEHMRRHHNSRHRTDLLDHDVGVDGGEAITSMLTVYRRPTHGAESQITADPNLRPPGAEDWQRWKPSIMARYKALPARLFIREMEAKGLRVR
jgi:hypothetical protein